ncbi:MAG TPA: GvpL/GvpF family gas vesicle protein [Gaiellaceae bacterium]|nr:GvpL/GvpF family gas vesicle protein [Gaiellaceae bacterium]
MALKTPSKTGLYCYGVTWADTGAPQRSGGLAGKSVEPVRFEELAALTSEAPLEKVRARRADLMCHFDVLSRAFEHGTVIPLRFGIVFDDEETLVEELLRARRDELAGLLRELRDRVELRVTALYREEAVLAEIVRENPRIARLRGEHSQPALIELGELVADELRARTSGDARAILQRLGSLSRDHEVDDEPIEHQVLRASFLVERKRIQDFDAAMDELAAGQAGRIDFRYVGPLPPHSFVGLEAR